MTTRTAYHAAMTTESGPPAGASDQELLDEFRNLVREAFNQARNSGKLHWDEMTSAVLKNRLLSLPGKPFSQERYGSPSFINLVRKIPDVVEVVSDHPPFLIRLLNPDGQAGVDDITSEADLSPATPPVRPTDWRSSRIRDDLWRAILDYSSGSIYVLDPATGQARHKTNADAGRLELPTITAEEFAGWRRQFADSISTEIRARFNEQLESWVGRGGPQSDLPRQIRGRWNEFIKKQVASVLHDWFETNGQESPQDMILESETRSERLHGPESEDARNRELNELRELVVSTVRRMTYGELAAIPLPAAAVLRAANRKPRAHG